VGRLGSGVRVSASFQIFLGNYLQDGSHRTRCFLQEHTEEVQDTGKIDLKLYNVYYMPIMYY